MSSSFEEVSEKGLDYLVCNLETLKEVSELSEVVKSYLEGDYKSVLQNATSQGLYRNLVETVSLSRKDLNSVLHDNEFRGDLDPTQVLISGLAAFNAFLQANVTGPPTDWENVFSKNFESIRVQCLKSLEIDGVSVYQHIPYIELFCLARMVFTMYFPRIVNSVFRDCKWMRVRVIAYHQRLLSGLSGGKLSDSTTLQAVIEKDLKDLEVEILGAKSSFSTEAKVQFLLEKAQIYIMEGLDIKAQENVKRAKMVSGFTYALSGALGKRTKFQQHETSQLVVFARSRESEDSHGKSLSGALENSTINGKSSGPKALQLDDDTLLESIKFSKSDKVENSALPPELKDMKPDEQPQLNPLDQIALLTEATVKDAFSPLDKLNSEEILPYAVRVLADKPTNWQVYTQALLVRSRIESHRSRTQERSVLQLQVIVDQIIASTQDAVSDSADSIPEIRVTQFLPKAKADESAPVTERLKYIYQLNTPTRWEIETELAYAWSGAGSLLSALEIFKRLKLWAEVALCYHSVGQEDKARQVIRRQLYYSTKGETMDDFGMDAAEVAAEKWEGNLRDPPPPHAPRFWCILGDLDNDPLCWERAWKISKNRYARAQRSLGEYYTKLPNLEKAREAYMAATVVNRQNGDTWSRLGDIDLRVGNWEGATIAFQQAIMIDETDAKTYSNLGSALLSRYAEMMAERRAEAQGVETSRGDEEEDEIHFSKEKRQDPKEVLQQALKAYKRGAAIAHSNWQIWDNVVTIAGRLSPPSFPDILLGMKNVVRIRSPGMGEDAVDVDILRALVGEVVSRPRTGEDENSVAGNEIYEPPRGSLARVVISTVEDEIVPLITNRYELWQLVEKLSLYRRDYVNALSCAEKGWRLATAGEEWKVEQDKWKVVVEMTDDLVSAYENYGSMEMGRDGKTVQVEKNWKGKARSAVRSVLGKARDSWEGSEEWEVLQSKLDELKA